jgi:beta-lactamase class A
MTVAVAALALIVPSGRMEQINLDQICANAVAAAQSHFPADNILPEDIGISLYLVNRAEKSWVRGGFRGDVQMYPASVVKMFFMAYAAHKLETGEIASSPEFERAASDMIQVSSNDATGYIVDKICGTTPGPELDEKGLREFGEKRKSVNRWFESHGYQGVNAVQRTYNEGPYGRERQWVGEKFDNRNMLSPDNCSMLMADIALGRHWDQPRVDWMKNLLSRINPQDDFEKSDGQARAYIGRVIPAGTKLFSKAGWTSSTRHDSAWLVLPDGREVTLTIFTTKAQNLQLVSYIAGEILTGLGYQVKPPIGDPVMPVVTD